MRLGARGRRRWCADTAYRVSLNEGLNNPSGVRRQGSLIWTWKRYVIGDETPDSRAGTRDRANPRSADELCRARPDDRRRGGVPPRQPRFARSRGSARGADATLRRGSRRPRQPRVPPMPDRGRHRRVRDGGRGARGAAPDARDHLALRGRFRPRADRGRLSPLRRLEGTGPHPQGALRDARAPARRRRAPDADLRHARPCRHRGPPGARRSDAAAQLLPAALAGALGLLPLLAGRGHGAGLIPAVDLRQPAAPPACRRPSPAGPSTSAPRRC